MESGESPLDASVRELMEETAARLCAHGRDLVLRQIELVTEKPTDNYLPSAGGGVRLAGVSLFVIGEFLLANRIESPHAALIGALGFFAAGFYLLTVGAVARGVQVARHWSHD